MQIEKIELENWMSYPRRWQDDGEEKRPSISLTSESLTLIAGENGSGKSAILETICYALFANYPRGSSYRSAIRSGEKEAKVRLFFSLPNGQETKSRFCIERSLTARGAPNATLHELVGEGSNDKILRAERQQAVTDYIQETLLAGISYETFVSSVFLRQQAAGKFMELTGGEQREQLLALCRLEIYEEIRKRANEWRRGANSRFADLDEQFQRVAEATAAALVAQEGEVERCERVLGEKQIAQKMAETVVRQTRQAEKLAQDIATQEDKLTCWQQLLAQKAEIEGADIWYRAWHQVEPLIREGRGLKTAVFKRTTTLENIAQQISQITPTIAQAEADCEAAETDLKTLQEALSAGQERLITLTNDYNEAKAQLSELERAKELDESITRYEREQAERAAELERYKGVRQQYELLRQLRETQAVLRQGLERLVEADELAEHVAEQEQKQGKVAEALRLAEDSLQQQQGERERLSLELGQIGAEEQTAVSDKNTLSKLLNQRQQALEAGRCPTCGLEMAGKIGEHVHKEADDLEEKLATLAERIAALRRQIEAGEQQAEDLEQIIEQTRRQRDSYDKQHRQHIYEIEDRKQQVTTLHDRVQAQWRQHHAAWPTDVAKPTWLREVTDEVLGRVETAVVAWDDVAADYDYLGRVQTAFEATADYLRRDKNLRSVIPIASPVTAEQIVAQTELCQHSEGQIKAATRKRDALNTQVKTSRRATAQAKKVLGERQKALSDVKSRQTQLETAQKMQTERLQQIQASLAEVAATKRDELAPRLLLAIEDESTWTELQQLARRQATTAGQLTSLREAEREAHGVKVLIDRFQADLAEIKQAVGETTVAAATAHLAELEKAVELANGDLLAARDDLSQLKLNHQERQHLEPLLAAAKQQAWAYGEIEQALTKGGQRKAAGALMAEITKTLMEGIATEASRVLAELGWHIGVDYGEKAGFVVEDRTAGVQRLYEEFSDGERFAISVAVALAVSRATSKTSAIRCLFIDEGFGALDERHRKRIVDDAIGRLISQGLRDQVVVITHIQDMQEHFPHRIELCRENGRSALVTPEII